MNKIDSQVLEPTEIEPHEGPRLGLLDLLIWLGEGKRVIGIAVAIALVLSLTLALRAPLVFTARTNLLPPRSQQQSASASALASLGSLGGLVSGMGGSTPDELYVSLLKSDSVQRALATKFDLYKRYGVETYEVLRKKIPSYVRVSSDKKSGLIAIEVDDEDPKFAADLANAHVPEITKLLGRLAVSEAQGRRVFFDQQLKDTKENLIKAEQALRTVQEKSGMIVLDKQAEVIIAAVAELKAKILEREVRLRVLRTTTTAQNPDVQLLNSELAAMRSELARMESAAPASAPQSGTDIAVGSLPAASVDYVRALREMKFQESLLASMLRQLEIAKMDEAKEGPVLQQVDVALPPDRKSKPSRATIVLIYTGVTLLGSILFVLLRRYRAWMREQYPESAQAWARLSQAWRLRRKPS